MAEREAVDAGGYSARADGGRPGLTEPTVLLVVTARARASGASRLGRGDGRAARPFLDLEASVDHLDLDRPAAAVG